MASTRIPIFVVGAVVALPTLFHSVGCESTGHQPIHCAPPLAENRVPQESVAPSVGSPSSASGPDVRLVSHQQPDGPLQEPQRPLEGGTETVLQPKPETEDTLIDLEAWAISNNPTLRRMRHEAAAEWAKTGYVDKLPDPTVSSMFFTPPMNFEPDRQLAELQLMQMIPWLGRLQAEAQRAYLEALVAEAQYRAERLKVIGDLRATWFKLYVLGKQIETTQADKAQLESLITTANARVATGDAQPGDVLMATLELSSLEEQLLGYRQQIAASVAELNRLTGREASVAIAVPTQIEAQLPNWDYDQLRQTAMENQPELNVARLRMAATRWGIEVARLKRRPDFTFGVGWVAMDAPGASMPDAGRDSLTLAVTTSIPVWHRKYDAMVSEASREHCAAHASADEVALQLDALLRDLWEQAKAKQQTVELYETTILPQARQTFEADQQALINNAVTFDRVIRDYRTLLTLELGYHRALGELATSLARIRQAAGVDLEAEVVPSP